MLNDRLRETERQTRKKRIGPTREKETKNNRYNTRDKKQIQQTRQIQRKRDKHIDEERQKQRDVEKQTRDQSGRRERTKHFWSVASESKMTSEFLNQGQVALQIALQCSQCMPLLVTKSRGGQGDE